MFINKIYKETIINIYMEIKNVLKNISKGNKYIGNILNSYKNEEIIENNIIKELVDYMIL